MQRGTLIIIKDREVSLVKRPYKKRKRKSDTKLKSLIECLFNISISLPLAFLINLIILPLYSESIYFATDIQTQAAVYGQIAIIFTVVSVIRAYTIRRLFNRFGTETGYSIIIKLIKNKKII